MKITYTAPNRSHHYPYVDALHRYGALYAFISGFTRFSSRSPLPNIGHKLKRYDFFQNLYVVSSRIKAPLAITDALNRLSNLRLDGASYLWAKDSDIFVFYRTQGFNTTTKLHRQGALTICVMEEVNSHVDYAQSILKEEFKLLKLKDSYRPDPDYHLRLKTYELSDYILCPSEFVKKSFITKGFSPDRLLKVNYGFPQITVQHNELKKGQSQSFRLLYVGQLHYRKGLHYAIEAFKKLRHPRKEFVIVGPKTFVTGLEKTNIPADVVFTGPLKGEALRAEFRRASAFVLPSLEEGLALVQGEALVFGIPIIITTNTGGEDIIKDGVEGFIVPPRDINALANSFQMLADDMHLRMQMSESALSTAHRLGNWDKAVHELVSQIREKTSR